jgi:hypothetical protein
VLVDVVRLVCRSQDLALVDEVHAESLENPCLHEVADAHLRHHGDRHRLLDRLDDPYCRHARHTAFLADVGGHALEGHHRAGPSLLCDLGLVRRGDVHDDASLEHLRETHLDLDGLCTGSLGTVSVFVAHGFLLGNGFATDDRPRDPYSWTLAPAAGWPARMCS